MRIIDKFSEDEIEKLENIGIEIRDREYELFEVREIEEAVMDAVMNNLDSEGEFTELAEDYNWIHDKFLQMDEDAVYEEVKDVTLRMFFDDRQVSLLEEIHVDLDRDYTMGDLEKLEDLIYNAMMENMNDGEYTEIAEEYEKIIDVIVRIENEM